MSVTNVTTVGACTPTAFHFYNVTRLDILSLSSYFENVNLEVTLDVVSALQSDLAQVFRLYFPAGTVTANVVNDDASPRQQELTITDSGNHACYLSVAELNTNASLDDAIHLGNITSGDVDVFVTNKLQFGIPTCTKTSFSWDGGLPPFGLLLTPNSDIGATHALSFSNITLRSLSLMFPFPVGTGLTILLYDSDDNTNNLFLSTFVTAGPTDCLMQDSNNFGTNVTAGTSSSRHEKTGPVVGGLIGALLLLGITFAALWISKKRRRSFTHNNMGTRRVQPFEVPLSVLHKVSRQKARVSRDDEDPSTPKLDVREVDPSEQQPPGDVEETTRVPARRVADDIPEVIYHRDGGRAVVEVPPSYDDLSGDGDSPVR